MTDSVPPPRVRIPLGRSIPWSRCWAESRLVFLLLMWGISLGYAGQRILAARVEFGNRSADADLHRVDGNSGHAQIDFGGQWVMGRQAVTGHFHDLYNRQQLWRIVREAYPSANESPHNRRNVFPAHQRDEDVSSQLLKTDAEWMMEWFMGIDPPAWQKLAPTAVLPVTLAPTWNPFTLLVTTSLAKQNITPEQIDEVNERLIGGPLYPPIHAFFYAPLGLLDPQSAYRLFQFVLLGLAFLAGLGVNRLTDGRIWWPVATTAILLWPGFRPGIDLGQNHVVTLTLLVWGWVLAKRGHDGWGGIVWGFLAFKPVWAVAFLLVPLMMRRRRFLFSMCGTGLSLIVLTLPFTGLQPWFDWLAIGREASAQYNVNEAWINLSRDLSGIPRRFLLDFSLPESKRGNPLADAASWGLLLVVFVSTVLIYHWRGRRRLPTGFAAGFLFLGTYLCCYRFMYYDSLISALAVAVLFAEPGRFIRLHTDADGRSSLDLGYGWLPLLFVASLFIHENYMLRSRASGTIAVGDWAYTTTNVYGATTRVTPSLEVATSSDYAWETLILLGFWCWCGWQLIRRGEPPVDTD